MSIKDYIKLGLFIELLTIVMSVLIFAFLGEWGFFFSSTLLTMAVVAICIGLTPFILWTLKKWMNL